MCFTESSGEQERRLSGVERRVVSNNAATDGGRWRSARSDNTGRGECWGRVSGRVQFLVVGETRRADKGAALSNGAVVVVYSGRFARPR